MLPCYGGKWAVKSEKSMRLSHMTGLQSHYQLKGLWKSNTEEMLEMRFAEREWGGSSVMERFCIWGGGTTGDDSQL